MIEQLKRIKFSKQTQQNFVTRGIKMFGGLEKMSASLGVSTRSINDWKRGKFSMSVEVAKKLAKQIKCSVPRGKIFGRYDHVKDAGKIGGRKVLERYGKIGGDEKKRIRAWTTWWKKQGRFKKNPILERKPVSFPKKSVRLAEFIGIMLGDGVITDYQITITLNRYTDRQYAEYVIKLIHSLFHVQPSIRDDIKNSTLVIFVSRRALVEWLTSNSVGLLKGRKIHQQVSIPKWIMKKPVYLRSCIRGLIDTDGSVVVHKYIVNGKQYTYKKINFSSASVPLLKLVFDTLITLKLKPRLDKSRRQLWVESIETVNQYMKIIGISNPKHLKRYSG